MNANTATRWTVMVAALVSTAYAEHHLATWLGWNTLVACVVPGVADLYLIYATRTGRDVAPAVSVVIGLSAANYICTAPLDSVRTPLSVAVSALAPLVLWRLHASEHGPIDELEEKVIEPLAEKRKELIWGLDEALDRHEVIDPAPEPREALALQQEETEAAPKDTDNFPGKLAPARLSDAEAKKTAEYAYVNNVSAAKAAKDVTRSSATVYRWYAEFREAGVKRLVTA